MAISLSLAGFTVDRLLIGQTKPVLDACARNRAVCGEARVVLGSRSDIRQSAAGQTPPCASTAYIPHHLMPFRASKSR